MGHSTHLSQPLNLFGCVCVCVDFFLLEYWRRVPSEIKNDIVEHTAGKAKQGDDGDDGGRQQPVRQTVPAASMHQ